MKYYYFDKLTMRNKLRILAYNKVKFEEIIELEPSNLTSGLADKIKCIRLNLINYVAQRENGYKNGFLDTLVDIKEILLNL